MLARRAPSAEREPMWSALMIVGGLVLLVAGAEVLVRGAVAIATRFSVPPLIVGLTIVAFGTSSPEVAVSLSAVYKGMPDIAVGNVVGSNTFNVLFIVGLSALICPLVVARKLVWVDVPIMIAATGALWLMLLDGQLGRLDGAMLFAGIVLYTTAAVRSGRRESRAAAEAARADGVEPPVNRPSLLRGLVLTAVGLGVTVLGARLLVRGAVDLATALGVSELIIGLTIVAAGTSLPEVATSVVAAVRGQRDIAVGNVVGSNIFNILGILGLTGLVAPSGVPVASGLMSFDFPVMAAASLACLPIFFTGHEIRRWEGALFLGAYVAYIVYIILDATEHDLRAGFSRAVLWLALPLVFAGVAGSVLNAVRKNRTHAASPPPST